MMKSDTSYMCAARACLPVPRKWKAATQNG